VFAPNVVVFPTSAWRRFFSSSELRKGRGFACLLAHLPPLCNTATAAGVGVLREANCRRGAPRRAACSLYRVHRPPTNATIASIAWALSPALGIVPIAATPRPYGPRYSLSFRRRRSSKLSDDLDL
jgi:hypothetical protein